MADDDVATPLDPNSLGYKIALNAKNQPTIPTASSTPLGPPPDIQSMGPQQMAGTPTQQALPPRQPGEGIAAQPPPSRADFFRKMLGDFFYAAGQGLSQAG